MLSGSCSTYGNPRLLTQSGREPVIHEKSNFFKYLLPEVVLKYFSLCLAVS